MAVCAPVDCCCQPWQISQGETAPLMIDFGPWLQSTGWPAINEIVEAEMLDMNVAAPFPPADEAELGLISGMTPDPPNSWPGFAVIRNGSLVEFIVQAGDDVAVGRTYRLNVRVKARDCEGRAITARDCCFIYVTSC
jgi:hypothetical protein